MRFRKRALSVAVGLLAAATILSAQRGGRGMFGIRRPGPNSFKGSFTFCCLAVGAASDGDGGSWGVDYPRADENLSIRLSELTQIPNIGFFSRSGGQTSERGPDSVTPHAGAIVDPRGRIAVLITHNTDFGDAYEREGDDPTYFYKFSVEGYAIGIDVLLYTLTH